MCTAGTVYRVCVRARIRSALLSRNREWMCIVKRYVSLSVNRSKIRQYIHKYGHIRTNIYTNWTYHVIVNVVSILTILTLILKRTIRLFSIFSNMPFISEEKEKLI